jgi:hypothetical protein
MLKQRGYYIRKFYKIDGELVEIDKLKWRFNRNEGVVPILPDYVQVCRKVESEYGAKGEEVVMEIDVEKEAIDPTPEESLTLFDVLNEL